MDIAKIVDPLCKYIEIVEFLLVIEFLKRIKLLVVGLAIRVDFDGR